MDKLLIKRDFLYCLIILFLVISSSCSTLQNTRKVLNVTTTQIITKPIIADVKVEETKIAGMSTGREDKTLEMLKKEAISDALSKNNADILVAPSYVIKKVGYQTTVTVKGYLAKYINIRQDASIIETAKSLDKIPDSGKISDKKKKPSTAFDSTKVLDNKVIVGVNSLNEKVVIEPSKIAISAKTNEYISNEPVDSLNVEKTTIDNAEILNFEPIVSDKKVSAPDRRPSVSETRSINDIRMQENKRIDSTVEKPTTKVENTKAEKTSTINNSKSLENAESGQVLMIDKNKYVGDVKGGVPNGIGTIYYNIKTKLSIINNLDVYARKGDYLKGRWFKGELEYGILYDSDGEVVSKITIGR